MRHLRLQIATSSFRSAQIRERIIGAREIQLQRLRTSEGPVGPGSSSTRQESVRAARTYSNAQMTPRNIRTFCDLSPDCERLLERAMTQQGLTARAHDRILKVARTVGDLEGSTAIQPKHIAEAIQYRTLDRTFWA